MCHIIIPVLDENQLRNEDGISTGPSTASTKQDDWIETCTQWPALVSWDAYHVVPEVVLYLTCTHRQQQSRSSYRNGCRLDHVPINFMMIETGIEIPSSTLWEFETVLPLVILTRIFLSMWWRQPSVLFYCMEVYRRWTGTASWPNQNSACSFWSDVKIRWLIVFSYKWIFLMKQKILSVSFPVQHAQSEEHEIIYYWNLHANKMSRTVSLFSFYFIAYGLRRTW